MTGDLAKWKFRGKFGEFRVPKAWTPLRVLGSGSYGTVVAFHENGTKFAVKKITNVFSDPVQALRTLREIRLLAHFRYQHVLNIREVFIENNKQFKDVYVCLELMDSDLASLIKKGREPLKERQRQSILFQVMCGVLCLHSACVIHRDLTPGNVLVSGAGICKIADMGLARSVKACSHQDLTALTEYVVTRFYRAPEVVLTATEYTYAIDIWSAGCILGEMLFQETLFRGKDSVDQIRKIVAGIGSHRHEDIEWIPKHSASERFLKTCIEQAWGSSTNLSERMDRENADPAFRDLLFRMLQFNPANRIYAEEIFDHEYLAEFRDTKSNLVVAARDVAPMDWSFDWELCYNDRGEPQRFDRDTCRHAMIDARNIVDSRNSKSGFPSLDIASFLKVEKEKDSGNAEAFAPTMRAGCGTQDVKKIPAAAERRKIPVPQCV